MTETIDLLPGPVREELTYRQTRDLECHYRQYRNWLRDTGKNPKRNIGYAPQSVHTKFHRTLQFHRWVWDHVGRITSGFDRSHADEYEKALAEDAVRKDDGEPYSEGSKRKFQQAVKNYFCFGACCLGGKLWKPNLEFSQREFNEPDYFTLDERQRLYQASLTYDDMGNYDDLSPEERDRGKGFLAQKLEKPKSEVSPDDFEVCRTSWKVPSIVSVTLDLGARPASVDHIDSRMISFSRH